jgi:hypothetical protein
MDRQSSQQAWLELEDEELRRWEDQKSGKELTL